MATGRSTDILFLYILDAKRSTLATGAVPSENLPSRLHDVPDPKPRREIDRVAVNTVAPKLKQSGHAIHSRLVSNRIDSST